jgi:hypothetical protein
MGDEHNSGALSIGFKSLVHLMHWNFQITNLNHALISTQNVNSICNSSQPWKQVTDSISTIPAAKLLAQPFNFHTTYL